MGRHPRRPGRAVGHRHAHQRPPADQPAGHHRGADPTGKATTPAATKPPATEPAETAPGIGERARDGKFEFVVSRVRCGVPRIGDQYLNKTAQGQFCLISVRVRNIGDEQRTFEQSSQYLFDTAGRRYETGDAGLYLEDSKSFLEDINPGNGVNGTLVYDVPKTFKPAKIELHDAAFSGGVEVTPEVKRIAKIGAILGWTVGIFSLAYGHNRRETSQSSEGQSRSARSSGPLRSSGRSRVPNARSP